LCNERANPSRSRHRVKILPRMRNQRPERGRTAVRPGAEGAASLNHPYHCHHPDIKHQAGRRLYIAWSMWKERRGEQLIGTTWASVPRWEVRRQDADALACAHAPGRKLSGFEAVERDGNASRPRKMMDFGLAKLTRAQRPTSRQDSRLRAAEGHHSWNDRPTCRPHRRTERRWDCRSDPCRRRAV